MTPLQKAARELIDRQTPGWVNTEPTSRSIEMLRKALADEQAQATRTALEQYDLDQSADYQKGWNDGRIKGYEVGHRYATEAKQAQAVEPATGDAEDEWRKLALQFDGQRMQALGHLRAMTLNPHSHMAEAMKFLAASPVKAQQVAVPAWTATADKMPEPCMNVLSCNGKKQPIRAMWVPAKTLEDGGDGDFGEYDEATDQTYWPEGWYETNAYEETHWLVDGHVTHWMSLPDAPQ